MSRLSFQNSAKSLAVHQGTMPLPAGIEEGRRQPSPTKQTAELKLESNDTLHNSSWQESDKLTMKLEDINTTKGYDSIANSFDCIVPETDIKLYKYRFWILSLFSACAIINGMQWGQYTIMADVNKCFYGIDIYAVDWTANIFVFLYIPLGLPAFWMINHYGIRISMITCSMFSCLSAGIQCLTLQPDTFGLVMVSQAAAAIAMVFVLASPPHLSVLWFGPEELSSACSTGIAAHMVGVALGFLLTPVFVPHDCSVKSDVSLGKRNIAYFLAVTNLVLFALVWATFREKPEKPPSFSQANKLHYESSYKKSLIGLCKTKNFMLLFTTYGIFCGTTTAIGVIFNPIILPHFPGKYVEIGWMSLTGIFAGIMGCVITGLFLDKTHAYRQLYLGLNISMAVLLVAFVAVLETDILWVQFISNFFLGFVANSHFSVGLEFASEITYPEPELVVTYLMGAAETIFSIIITMFGSWLEENHGTIVLFSFFEALLLVGVIITAFTKCESKRSVQNRLTEN